jgi:hypothetical protein
MLCPMHIHTSPLFNGYQAPVPGVKHGWGVTTTHSIYCQGQECIGTISSPPWHLHGSIKTALYIQYYIWA